MKTKLILVTVALLVICVLLFNLFSPTEQSMRSAPLEDKALQSISEGPVSNDNHLENRIFAADQSAEQDTASAAKLKVFEKQKLKLLSKIKDLGFKKKPSGEFIKKGLSLENFRTLIPKEDILKNWVTPSMSIFEYKQSIYTEYASAVFYGDKSMAKSPKDFSTEVTIMLYKSPHVIAPVDPALVNQVKSSSSKE